MRMLLKISIPTEAGNRAVKDGTLPRTWEAFQQAHKPEAAYFTTEDGDRTAFFFLDLPEVSSMPLIAEPFFVGLGAKVTWSPVMTPADLKAGLAKMGK